MSEYFENHWQAWKPEGWTVDWRNVAADPYLFDPVTLSGRDARTLRMKNRTLIHHKDAPDDKSWFYKILDSHNRDSVKSREDTNTSRQADSEYHANLIQGMCNQVGLHVSRQKYAKKWYYMMKGRGKPTDVVAFAAVVCALRIGINERSHWPTATSSKKIDSEFVLLQESIQKTRKLPAKRLAKEVNRFLSHPVVKADIESCRPPI
jgi:hypothetical protein